MKKSIPLKEIVGFLPYGLKWNLPLTSERYESILENECYGIIELSWAIENNYPNAEDYLKMTFTQKEPFIAFEDNKLFLGQMKCSLGWEEDDVFMEEMLPVMHPMSDLTKEITHNGETFVPALELVKLKEKYGKWKDSAPSIPYLYKIVKKPFGNMLKITKLDSWVIMMSLSEIERSEYFIVEKLKEWHFDIYDWIKDGLAVDLNTL